MDRTRTQAEKQQVNAVIYLRLSDLRLETISVDDANAVERAFEQREAALQQKAAQLEWTVARVIRENDLTAGRNGKVRAASAFKRRKVTLPDGTTKLRVIRPGFREVIELLDSGTVNGLLAEDLDRTVRDPRDLEDLIDVCRKHGCDARSISGSLTLTNGGTDGEITMARVMVSIGNKSSLDTSRRVASGRERAAMAGKWSAGGQRRFGFERDGVTWREDEAAILQEFARRFVEATPGTAPTLRSLVGALNDSGITTPSGTPWSGTGLRDVLLRPRNAGILVHKGQEVGPAPWDAIIPEDMFRSLVRILTDESRRTTPGSRPKWLGSGIYKCGVCGGTCRVKIRTNRKTNTPRYTCHTAGCIARRASLVDSAVRGALAAYLTDEANVLAWLPRPQDADGGPDVDALKAERERIRRGQAALMKERALGLVDAEEESQYQAARQEGMARLKEINEALTTVSEGSPLQALVSVADIENTEQPSGHVAATLDHFDSLPLATRRDILDLVLDVTINRFDPRRINQLQTTITPKEPPRAYAE